jgi:DNA polymerase-3 subunit chi
LTEIDFYILPDSDEPARQAFVARLAEKILRARHQLTVLTQDPAHSEQISAALWSSRPESFIAHTNCDQDEQPTPADSVIIGHKPPPDFCHDVLLNLTQDVGVNFFSRFRRAIHVVIQSERALSESREHYQFYKSREYPLRTHDLRKK